MTVIGTNIASLRAGNASNAANNMLQQAMQRLSTGQRINSGKDDAAGIAIASSMTASIRGMNQGIRNANDGIAMAATADGALNEVSNMLQRVRELAVQSASGTYSDDDRTNLQTEVAALTTQITSVLTNTQFNKVGLFDGSAGSSGTITIQAGATSADTVTMSFSDIDLSSATSVDISDSSDASDALGTIDDALATVNTARASFGAAASQLQSVVNNLSNNVENLSQARSGIQDADFSAETAALAKAQILSQASTAMLAQANQSQQGVLSLLRYGPETALAPPPHGCRGRPARLSRDGLTGPRRPYGRRGFLPFGGGAPEGGGGRPRSRHDVGRAEMLEEIRLAERHTGMAQDRVGGGRVEEEVGERETGQIGGAGEAITHAIGEAQLDRALLGAGERSGSGSGEEGDGLVAALLQLGEAGFGVGHRRRVDPAQPGEGVLRAVRRHLILRRQRLHVGREPRLDQFGLGLFGRSL